jgi:hypothetical protein
MKSRIHFIVRPEPISQHGNRQMACCGQVVERAQPVIIVPDAIVVSIGMIADQFGSKMCRECKLIEPQEGYIYFMAEAEEVETMRRKLEYAEVG